MKFSAQVVNIDAPNAPQNTHVLIDYEGKDYWENLNELTPELKSDIHDMEITEVHGKSVRAFLTGDYEFETTVMGLSGANGRHCCLWCEIDKKHIQLESSKRPCNPQPRTLRSIRKWYKKIARISKMLYYITKSIFLKAIKPIQYDSKYDLICFNAFSIMILMS